MEKINIGIDIGGTYTKISVLNLNKKEIALSNKFLTNSQNKKEEIINNLIFEIKKIKKKFKSSIVNKITITVPGLIDKNQKIINLPNIKNLNNTDLKKILKEEFKENKVSIIKDSHSIFYFIKNNIKANKNFAIITLGTSIACSIIINSKLYTGKGNSGEIAHNYFSNKQLEELVSNKTILEEIKKCDNKITKIEDLNELKEIPQTIKKIFEKYGKHIGIALANLNNTLDLDEIFLTGGMLYNQELFLKSLKQEFEKKSFVPICNIEILESDSFIGSIGACFK